MGVAETMRLTRKRLLLPALLLLSLGFVLTFLPLWDCALCESYKVPRSQRRFCACNANGKANLLQLWVGRAEVRQYVLRVECNGSVGGGRPEHSTRCPGRRCALYLSKTNRSARQKWSPAPIRRYTCPIFLSFCSGSGGSRPPGS